MEFVALVTTDDGGSGGDDCLIAFAMLRARLWVARKLLPMYAVTQDGLKFLVLEPQKSFLESYSAILNWPATLH